MAENRDGCAGSADSHRQALAGSNRQQRRIAKIIRLRQQTDQQGTACPRATGRHGLQGSRLPARVLSARAA